MNSQHAGRAAVLLAALWAVPVQAEDIVVASSGARETHDCRGDGIVINGSANTITLRDCETVSINGANNRVSAGRAGKISVLGSGNKVTYTPGDREPKVVNLGVGNQVSAARGGEREEPRTGKENPARDSAADMDGGSSTVVIGRNGKVDVDGPAGKVTVERGRAARSGGDDLVLDDNRQTGTHNCNGGNVVVRGDRNTYSFRDCATVVVSGDRNTIDAREAETIEVSGDRNTVSWRGSKPRVLDTGDRNTVAGR